MAYKDPDRQRLFQKLRKRAKKEWFWKFKSELKCERCGFSHPAALQFHHFNEKTMGICIMVQRNYSEDRIKEEISKCQVLCANCHAIEHYETNYKYLRTA